ncbi:hypothetical protein GQ42DRAFT_169143 [Ramicandelaber brevisporus]|nr:hypothetical protein GQ42DRAFT_169143 [Ramicandelaber brevisporus]
MSSSSSSTVEATNFETHAVVAPGLNLALIGTGLGATFAALETAITKHDQGAKGVFTRSASRVGYMAVAGGIYGSVQPLLANMREKNDPWNAAAAGCAVGFVIGAKKKALAPMLGRCALMGAIMGGYEATGGLESKLTRSEQEVREWREKSGFNNPVDNLNFPTPKY